MATVLPFPPLPFKKTEKLVPTSERYTKRRVMERLPANPYVGSTVIDEYGHVTKQSKKHRKLLSNQKDNRNNSQKGTGRGGPVVE